MILNQQGQQVFLDWQHATQQQKAEVREVLTPSQPFHGKMFRLGERAVFKENKQK